MFLLLCLAEVMLCVRYTPSRYDVLKALESIVPFALVLFCGISIRDIYLRDLGNQRWKIFWTLVALSFVPAMAVYFWRHGFRARKTVNIPGKGVRLAMAVLIVLAAMFYFFATKVVCLYEGNKILKDNPGARLFPHPLKVPEVERRRGKVLSYLGYQMEVPWGEARYEKQTENAAMAAFKNGKSVFFSSLRSETPVAAALGKNWRMSLTIGKDALKSEYAFYQAALSASPEDLSFWKSKGEVARTFLLLGFKLGPLIYERDPTVLSFEHNGVRGFQTGAPSVSSHIKLSVFDETCLRLMINISADCRPGKEQRLSQDEITHIIVTLKPISEKREKDGRS